MVEKSQTSIITAEERFDFKELAEKFEPLKKL